MFPILKQKHPYPNALSAVYAKNIFHLLEQARVSTYYDSYQSYWSYRGNVRIIEVTEEYLRAYESWMLKAKNKSITSVGMYARGLRAVSNEAIEMKFLSQEQYPFGCTRKALKRAVPTAL